MKRYNPSEIEPKWQKWWIEKNTYTADLNSYKPKYMASGMFNYPSGDGIHLGHAYTFTIPDVHARFKRQQGYESLNPVGWDAFGLPAENYAIKMGISPQKSMASIIPNYRKQYTAMGWGVDWTKEINSSEPLYYKWTQWIFSQMYRNGLAYQDSRMQWWCDQCQTVLANEQVDANGKCWRHDKAPDPVIEKKEVKQWFFKITEYADELLEAVDDLNWTESVKLAQKNWIGRSVGAEIDFNVKNSDDKITVFTTRPDTLFGATFLVLAPESELLESIVSDSQREAIDKYIKETAKKTEVERQAAKEKTGFFTGAYAINPVNNEEIAIWVADYVLVGYGTGAIMAVPAHDERDNEFAQKYGLSIVRVVKNDTADDECTHDEGIMINSSIYNDMHSDEAREKIVADLEKKGVAREKVNYKMRDWSVSRQRYWGAPIPIINCNDCGPVLISDKDLPVVLPELTDFQPSGDGRSALARATDWLKTDCPKCGKPAERETDTLDTYICSSWYLYRYIDSQNEQKIFDSELVNKWFPMDFYDGADHAVAHLLYARFIGRFFNKIGLVDNPEPLNQMLYHGKVLGSDGSHFSKSAGNGIDPLEIINSGYGADALRVYLMFAAPAGFNIRWDPQGVPGAHRFLSRIWTLVQEYLDSKTQKVTNKTYSTSNLVRVTHKTIKKVTEDIEENRYNTAIATLMALVNSLYKFKNTIPFTDEAWRNSLETVISLTAPFAPHVADELWQQMGNTTSVQVDSWPKWNNDYLISDMMKIVVQVNGKVRATVELSADASEEDVVRIAQENEKVAEFISGNSVKKSIYVPNKLVNFVV